ncbi:MAG: tRNA lysidine(34) synthetase TilS [Treponema sp.]|jgi:tRNA(Ile)-lysidine synthase|nr:tRNA lysidine(34) synthetase TilS [Treponema sp.]
MISNQDTHPYCNSTPHSPWFENSIVSELENYSQETVFLAAVSGGADSMAMLAALCASFPKERLFCLHVDHGLRPSEETLGDAELVRDFCEKRGVRFNIEAIPPGKIEAFARRKKTGIEAAARYYRHRALSREAARLGDNTLILIAHTKDDMLETALMRILRGAGPAGLAAMPSKKGRIVRPLLSMSRSDVISYLNEKNISWREDSTNADNIYLRNKIRNRLIPLLDELFPSWKKGVKNMAETQSLAAALISAQAQNGVIWEREGNTLVTCSKSFFALPQIVREEALYFGRSVMHPKGVDDTLRTAWRSINCNEMKNARRIYPEQSAQGWEPLPTPKRSVIRKFCTGSVTSIDLGQVRVKIKDDKVVLFPGRGFKGGVSESGFSLLIKEAGLYTLKRTGIEVRAVSAMNSADSGGFFASLPLVFRRSFKGDFVENSGRKIRKRDLPSGGGFPKSKFVSAVDRFGTAAFIGSGGLLFARDKITETDDDRIFYVTIK